MWTEQALNLNVDGQQLSAIIHRGNPDSNPSATKLGVLVVVGGPQYRVGSHRQFVHLARYLAASGIAVMRFDVTGMGDSEGDRKTFDQLDSDIHAAIDGFMKHMPELNGVVLWGLCDGASAALIYAPSDDRVKGLVLLNPWLENETAQAKTQLYDYYLKRLLSGSFWRKLLSGGLDIRGSTRELSLTLKTVTASVEETSTEKQASPPYQQRMLQSFGDLQIPLCWILSGSDLTAKEFERQYFSDKHWKKIAKGKATEVVRLADADHTFSTKEWKQRLARNSLSFLKSIDS